MPYANGGIGWQRSDTSRLAAHSVRNSAQTIRHRILSYMKHNSPQTTEQIASNLRLTYREVQPRISELYNSQRLRDTGNRVIGSYGRNVILWAFRK